MSDHSLSFPEPIFFLSLLLPFLFLSPCLQITVLPQSDLPGKLSFSIESPLPNLGILPLRGMDYRK